MQGCGTRVRRRLGIRLFCEQELDDRFAGVVFEGRGHHERCPAGAVLDVWVEGTEGGEEFDDVEMVVATRPVDG